MQINLIKTQGHGDGGIGGELQGVVLGVGDMALIAGGTPGAHLGIGKGDFERGQVAHHLGQPRRGQAVGKAGQGGARHVHVDQHAGEVERGDRHRFGGHGGIKVISGDKAVDHVEIRLGHAVHLGDATL